MTRMVWPDNGAILFYRHGSDGLGGMVDDIGTIADKSWDHGGGTRIWDGDSGKGTTEVAGNFTVGESVSVNYGFFSKNHEGTFRGTYTYTYTESGEQKSVTFLVVHVDDSYGGVFILVGPRIPDAQKKGFEDSFTKESQITAETHVVCFLPGTLVATPAGERTVETLSAGDMVLTLEGNAVPVKWIGRQTVSTVFGPAERMMPVRFEAGALGDGLPHEDLTVTADHAMLVDGVLCQAATLVNGTTVIRVPLSEIGEKYTAYHVETERHEIILANGAPAETFIDNVTRRAFDNYAEFEALFGQNAPEMEELPHPRASNARQLPQRIRLRFGVSEADSEKVA